MADGRTDTSDGDSHEDVDEVITQSNGAPEEAFKIKQPQCFTLTHIVPDTKLEVSPPLSLVYLSRYKTFYK